MSPKAKFSEGLERWHKLNGVALAAFLGNEQDAARLWFAARNALNSNPALLNTSVNTFCASLVMCAQMKHYPGPSGEAALVPIGGETQYWPMFKGMIKNGSRSGNVHRVQAVEVCENDLFDVSHGLKPKLVHKINYKLKREDRGDIIAVYATYEMGHKGEAFEVMSIEDINAIRDASPSVKRKRSSPWTSGPISYIEMCKKTVIKRGFKDIDITPDFAQLIAVDNSVERHGMARVKPIPLDSIAPFDGEFTVDPLPFEGTEDDDEAPSAQQETPRAIEHQERITVTVPQAKEREFVPGLDGPNEPPLKQSISGEPDEGKPLTTIERLRARTEAIQGARGEEPPVDSE